MKKQAEIDWSLVMKLFAGGALTGAGLGAGTSFMRHLQNLRDQTRQDTSLDDDVLYLNLPERPPKPTTGRRKVASTSTFAAGGMAGILGTLLAYNAVRGAYQKARKKRLQQELDQAQNIYLTSLSPGDMGKQASQFGMLSTGVGSVYLALLLSALGSGVVANKILQKNFPAHKNPNRMRPRKIVVCSPHAEGEDERTLVSKNEITPDALEGLVRTDLDMPKVANADGSLADLVAAVASGRGAEFKDHLENLGLETALDLVKGARHEKVSSFRRNLALTWICSDPMVSEAIAPLAAAEFQEGGGEWVMKTAAEIEDKYQPALCGLVEASAQKLRQTFYAPVMAHRKLAMDLGSGSGMLENVLLAKSLSAILGDKKPQDDGSGHVDSEAPGSSKAPQPGATDTPVSVDSTPPDVELSNQEAKNFWEQYGPAVDSAVARV